MKHYDMIRLAYVGLFHKIENWKSLNLRFIEQIRKDGSEKMEKLVH